MSKNQSSAAAKGQTQLGEVLSDDTQPRRTTYNEDLGGYITPIDGRLDIYGQPVGASPRRLIRLYGGRAKVGRRR